MKVVPLKSYSVFKKQISGDFKNSRGREKGIRVDKFRKCVGNEATRFRTKHMITTGNEEYRHSRWQDLFDKIQFDEERETIRKIDDDTISELKDQQRNIEFYIAIYYCFHSFLEDTTFSDTIDELVFGGPLRKQGDPVFVAALEPTKPSAPFEYPNYVSEEKANDPKSDEGIWLNPHNHYSIPFEERDEQIKKLNEFVEGDNLFSICALIAPSGAGKTRLVSQWMKQYVPTNTESTWDAGIVKSRYDSVWRKWNITKNTLIVIDYTYNYDRVIKAICRKCKNLRDYKIRLLIVDHVFPEKLYKDLSWNATFPSQTVEDTSDDKLFFEHSPIELKSEAKDSSMLRKIIAATASSKTHEYHSGSSLIVKAGNTLFKMGKNAANPDAVRHPLFAALLGQALRDGKKNITTWTRRDLIKHYFDKPSRKPWVQTDENKHAGTIGLFAGAYVCVATLRREVEFRQLQRCLAKNIREDNSPIPLARQIDQLANRVVSSSDLEKLAPFEPDILGENFLLIFLEITEQNKELQNILISMLCVHNNQREEETAAINFLETMTRLISNLSNDDQELVEVREGWRSLKALLQPEQFPTESLMRQAVSLVLVRLVEQLKLIEFTDLAYTFLASININDLCTATHGTVHQKAALSSIILILEWSKSFDLENEINQTKLLEELANAEQRTKEQQTALMIAAQNGNINAVKIIIKYSKDKINFSDIYGESALIMAITSNHFEIVKLLLHHGADTEIRTGRDETALFIACRSSSIQIIDLLLRNGADSNAGDSNDRTVLMLAAKDDNCKVLDTLLKHDVNIDRGSWRDTTALMYAANAGNKEAIEILIKHGANINLRDREGDSAIMLACNLSSIESTKALLDHNPVVSIPNRYGKIPLAVDIGNKNIIATYYFKKYKNDLIEFFKDNILSFVSSDCSKIIGQIADEGVKLSKIKIKYVDDRDAIFASIAGIDNLTGKSALYLAIKFNRIDIVSSLLKDNTFKLDSVEHGEKQFTPLMIACFEGRFEIASLLLDYGADASQKSCDDGWTALSLAVLSKNTKLVALLLMHGVDINESITENEITALMIACSRGSYIDVKLLLSYSDLRIDKVSKFGETALTLARDTGNARIVELLEQFGRS